MANIHQTRSFRRKVVYLIAMLALFSVGLFYRHWVIEPMANELQLREAARGEVELTSSAVRHLMTGSRGLATTFLWAAAIEKQKRHEWNEVELLVASITKLQPNFVTPWLFQSWNLAFNVSVECDRPRDKYYYVARGIDLLAEGERRNRGRGASPGDPEIRQTIGVYYLRKIGLSDEKTTMRCLHDLSCIDPLLRNPKWFYQVDPKQRREVVNGREFARFCQANPRLVRRLREGLNCATPADAIDFLDKNRDVPSRFENVEWAKLPARMPEQRQSRLKDPTSQFPILPPAREGIATRPGDYDLSTESVDVFLTARSWIEYSVEPLPPPTFDDKEIKEIVKQQRRYRLPKSMALILFRGYPARCQAYIAEGLEEEGWFDDDGWIVPGHWLGRAADAGDGDLRVGFERKYHAQPAWDRAALLYEKYGRENDLLMSPRVAESLNAAAAPYRDKYKVPANRAGELRADDREALRDAWLAHHRLVWSAQNRTMTNFDNHYWAALAERSRNCIVGRKLFHRADIARKVDADLESSLDALEQSWPFWIDALLENPKFASQPLVQEDIYEYLFKAIKLTQNQRSAAMRPVLEAAARLAIWPHPPLDALLSPSDKQRIFPIRDARGVLEWIQTPDLPDQDLAQTRLFLSVWPNAAAGFPAILPPPSVRNQALVRWRLRSDPLPAGWRWLIDDANVQSFRDRLATGSR